MNTFRDTKAISEGGGGGGSNTTDSSRSAPVKRTHSDSCKTADIITTGAFYTRATLRKLGSLVDPETSDAGMQVGDRVRVASLDKKWYAAVVLSISGGKALVHYPGWEHSFNEWIALDSRRLQGSGSGSSSGGDEVGEFDLQQAIQEAQTAGGALAETAAAAAVDSEEEEGEERLTPPPPPRSRGRPTGSRNRRRVGHIKKRIRKTKEPEEQEQGQEPASAAAAVGEEQQAPAVVGKENTPPPPSQPEYRIAKARPLHNGSSNPYAKQLHGTQSFESDDESTAAAAAAAPRNEVWQLVRGQYVTTGAFLTRRTVKCLAHNESTGGIIQDHHGVYPGQMVQVMNANRKWYRGRVLSYADKKFLVHFVDWDHSHDEWVTADSKRIRKTVVAEADEDEEDARRICARLVDEYNAYVEGVERAREEARRRPAAKRRVVARPTPTVVPASVQAVSLAGKAIADEEEEEEDGDIDEDVEPISVDSGYSAVPQLLRVKDYVRIYRRGMAVAARDRNKVWWRAEIVDIRTFRFRVHYVGFPRVWDEWMEMNTQRVMLADDQPARGEEKGRDEERGGDEEKGGCEERGGDGEKGGDEERGDGDDTEGDDDGHGQPGLSLRLALKRLDGSSEIFPLPTEHMAPKDYALFLKAGDAVQIRDGAKQWCACTIMAVKHGRIRVSFNGRASADNQWVAANSARIRVLRATVEADGRLQRLAHAAEAAARRTRDRAAARRRRARQLDAPTAAWLVRAAESREHIGDACVDDVPLLFRLCGGDGGGQEADALPLATRMLAEGAHDSATWMVYCNQCRVVIRTFRYYCVACERPSAGLDYESFDLCLPCFARRFPRDHAHAPAAFARAAVADTESIVAFAAGVVAEASTAAAAAASTSQTADLAQPTGLAQPIEPMQPIHSAYELDSFGAASSLDAAELGGWQRLAAGLHGTAAAGGGGGDAVIGRADSAAQHQRRCAFCGGADSARDAFVAGGRPFVLGGGGGGAGAVFWAHDACARHSPEVLATAAGAWYNVAAALRRARTIKCARCRKRGASVGCLHERCQRSYHVPCTGMTRAQLDRGMTFWCPRHCAAAAADGGEAAPAPAPGSTPLCACCARRLDRDLLWMVCAECPPKDAQGFCVCLTCYEAPAALANHPHKKRCFRERTAAGENSAAAATVAGARRGLMASSSAEQCCHYCRRRNARRWRRGYGGVVMCDTCFGAAHRLDSRDDELFDKADEDGDDDDDGSNGEVVALNPFGALVVDDYAHSAYFTRDACAATTSTAAPLSLLASYGPTDAMLYTLIVDSTYFDIPGRAPRWASHSGSDYHGTWLPQTVRRALLRYTRRGDRVLSNFLGRGTDAIESFLLSRKCVGVDINPSAVALAQRNCSFPTAPGMAVEFRPVIMHGDARALCDDAWPGAAYFAEPESFDHVLSHPPYKDCVLYSTNIDGDLSRFPGPDEFRREMEKVIATSWRLLRMGRYLTLGIGDNRAECFYIPVSFQLIRSYIAHGFVLDELIVKRQRYCQAFGLGMYLCVQFDFLMFTHEFIATLRKVPRDSIDLMYLPDDAFCTEEGEEEEEEEQRPLEIMEGVVAVVAVAGRVLREVPPSPIERKSVVMGSVWSFDKHHRYSFPHLCMSRMVERFGRDHSNWEHVDLALISTTISAPAIDSDSVDSDSDSDDSSSGSIEFQDNGTRAGDYERRRQRQIQQNRAQLLHLGLVSELGEDSSDTAHYEKLVAMSPRLPIDETPLALIVVPHIPNSQFRLRHIEPYRRALVQLTHDASRRLCPAGILVLGTQDVRDENGKLWPLGMLVLEDVQRAVGAIRLRLKEFIVVVEHGHARKRDDVVSRDCFTEEQCVLDNGGDSTIHLPIVHAYYLVFMKLK